MSNLNHLAVQDCGVLRVLHPEPLGYGLLVSVVRAVRCGSVLEVFKGWAAPSKRIADLTDRCTKKRMSELFWQWLSDNLADILAVLDIILRLQLVAHLHTHGCGVRTAMTLKRWQ